MKTDLDDDFQQFMIMLRQALLMIVAWIERRYKLGDYKGK